MSKLCSSKCGKGSRTEMAGLISDLIKQEKQVRSGRLVRANPPIPLDSGRGILRIAGA